MPYCTLVRNCYYLCVDRTKELAKEVLEDVITAVGAPREGTEATRVGKRGGKLVLVDIETYAYAGGEDGTAAYVMFDEYSSYLAFAHPYVVGGLYPDL